MKKIVVTIEEGKMIAFSDAKELDGVQYTIPYDLEALTIGQAQEIYKLVDGDDDYLDYLSGKKKDLWSSDVFRYARKAMRAMAVAVGIEESAVESMTDEEVLRFAPNFELNVLRPLFQLGMYQPQHFDGFDFEGVHYTMPLTAADGFGGTMPMADVTAEEWAESNDLRIACEHSTDYMHLIVAILCRPEGEKYNERVARERAERFKNLPCSVGLDVFFCKLSRMNTLASLTLDYLESLQAEEKAKEEVATPPSGNGNNDCTSQQLTATES